MVGDFPLLSKKKRMHSRWSCVVSRPSAIIGRSTKIISESRLTCRRAYSPCDMARSDAEANVYSPCASNGQKPQKQMLSKYAHMPAPLEVLLLGWPFAPLSEALQHRCGNPSILVPHISNNSNEWHDCTTFTGRCQLVVSVRVAGYLNPDNTLANSGEPLLDVCQVHCCVRAQISAGAIRRSTFSCGPESLVSATAKTW